MLHQTANTHTRTHTHAPQHAADYEPTRTNTSHKNPKQQQPRMSPEYFRPSAKPVGESVQVCVCACVLVSMADSSLPPSQMSCWNHPSLSFVLHTRKHTQHLFIIPKHVLISPSFSCPSTTLLVLLHFSKLGHVFKCMNKVWLSGINIKDYKQVSRKSCNFNFRYLRGYSDNLLHYTSTQLFCIGHKRFHIRCWPTKDLEQYELLVAYCSQ